MSSNNVDERVVKMTFDNDQFEAGVKQTLSSLEELKQSLKFNNSLTGIQAVSSAFNSFSLSNISSQIDELSNKFSAFGTIGKRVLENLTDSAFGKIKSTFSSTIGQIESGGWNRASSIAQARFSLQGLLKDEEKVEQAFKSASNAVNDTAYSLNSSVTVASQLATTGVDVGQEMEDSLLAIAGTAAMTGASFEDIGNIFVDVSSAGRLTGDALTRLSYRGVNAKQIMADALHTTSDEVAKMASKGEISFKQFSDAMQEHFGEHAKAANKTFSGQMDNIKSALSRIGQIFASGIIENDDLVNALNSVRLTINAIKNAISPIEGQFKNLVSSASKFVSSLLGNGEMKFEGFATFVELIGEAMDYTAGLIDKWTALNDEFRNSALGQIVEEAKEASEAVYAATEYIDAAWAIWNEGAYGVGETRRKALINAFGEEGADIVQGLVNQIAWGNSDIEHYDISMLTNVKDAVDDVTDSVEDTAEAAGETAERFNPIIEIMKAFGHYASGVKVIFTNIKTIVTKLVTSFKKVFSWKDLTQDISDYGDAFSEFFEKFKLSEDQTEKLETALTGLWSAIDLVRMIIKALVIGLSKSLGPVLSIIFDALLSIAAKVGELITGFQQWYRENDILRAALSFLGNVIKNVVEYVVIFFEKLNQLPAIEKIKEALSNLGELIGGTLTGLFGDATEATDKFFGELNEGDSSKMDEVLDTINTALENMIEFCSSAKGSVSDLFGWLSDNISSLLGFKTGLDESGNKLSKLKSIGENVANSKSLSEFISNISDGLSKLGLSVDTFVNWVIEKFNKLDAAKLAVMGLGGTLTVFGLSLSYLSYNVAEFVKTFTAFPVEIVNTVRSFRQVFAGISTYLQNDSQAKVLKAWAIAIGVLAASFFILTNFTDTTELLKVMGAMGLLMIIMAASVKMMTSTAAKMGSEKMFFKTLSAISLMFVAIAASAFILTEALKNLTGLSWNKNIIGPCVALVAILGALVGVVAIASTLNLDDSLAKTGLGIALFSAGVWLVAQAFKVLNDVELDGIYDKVWALIGIIATLAVFSLAASRLSFSNAVGVLTVIGSIFLIELALKDILYNGISLTDIAKNMDKFGAVLIALAIIAGFMVVVGLTCKKASNIAVNILATAVSIYIVVKAIQKIAEVPLTGILKALGTLTVIFFGIRLLINQLAASPVASNAGKNILKISLAIAILAVVVGLIGNLPIDVLGRGLLVVTVLTALIAGLIFVSQFAKDIDYKALYAIVVAIGVMALVVTLISFIDDLDAVYAAAGIMSLMLLSLGMSLYLAGKYAKRLQTSHLVVMVTALVIIAGSLFLLSEYGDIGKMITAAISICGVLLVIATSLAIIKKAMGSTDFGKNNRISMLILMISMLAVVAAALYILGKNDPASTAVAALALIAVLYVVVTSIGKLTNSFKNSKFDSKLLLVLVSVALLMGVVAAALYVVLTATKGMPFETIIVSVLAIGGILLAVAGVANYLSGVSGSFNIKTFGAVLSVCAMLVAVAYSLKLALSAQANWYEMLSAAAAMILVIAAVATAIGILSKLSESGIGMLAIIVVAAALSVTMLALGKSMQMAASAIMVIVEAIKLLTTIDLTPITENIGTLWQLVLIFAVLSGTSLIFGAGLVAIGIGLVAVGVGAAVIVAALAGLAAVVIITLAATTKFIVALNELINTFKTSKGEIQSGISEIGSGLANAITNFTQTLADNSEKIASNISTILLNILTAFIDFRNDAIDVIAEGILKFLDIIDKYGPKIADKATKTLLDILGSLAKNAGKIATVGAYIVAMFVIGVFQGLSEKIGDILNAAMGFAISFIYGIADTIYENTQPLIDAMKFLGLVLVRELIAAFNIGGVFDESLKVIDGEIEYQKSLREDEGKEAKEAFNDGVNSVDNAEIGEIDTSKATKSAGVGGTKAATNYATDFKNTLTDKITEYSGDIDLDKVTDLIGGSGSDSASLFMSNLNTGLTETKVDVSSIPENIKSQLQNEGYTYSEDGKYLVKEIQAGSEEEAQNYGDYWSETADPSLMDAMDETTNNAGEKATEAKDNYIDGIVNLTDDDIRRIREEYARVGTAMVVGTSSKDGIDSSSPSKKAIQLGNYFVDGLIVGGEELSNKLSESYAHISDNAVNAAAQSMSSISKIVQDDSVDWTPTLTPVIDGTQLQNGSNLLTATFGNSALNLAADTALSVNDASASNLAEQVAQLSNEVKRLADTDYSKMLDGVNINVNSQTTVDGTPLRKMASSYTIQQVDAQQRAYNMSRGARA